MTTPALGERMPPGGGPDELLEAFEQWAADAGFELYEHQQEAMLHLLADDNVVLATPTGSGKSLVAMAGIFAALARGRRAVYTAPVKALVSEKFFELTTAFGADRVGMVTGDATVNGGAPVIACTAEILANRTLRAGAAAGADFVVMDEIHYYGDRDRGWAWQVPLLELRRAQFLLMSATLGDTARMRADLAARTGRDAALVAAAERPVPLDFEYRETPLHVSVEKLLEQGKAPVYIVHFTQKEASARAQSLTSLDVLGPAGKAAVREAVGGFRFDTPVGKDLRRFVTAGIGVHHAGLLPKYRLLVEKLAQQGHLRLICGTDTLGVGVNMPVRTVLFTQLFKYDGRRTRVLSVRDFQQIAGRAGRRGFDDAGSVWVQAPEHVVENKRAEVKAAAAAAAGGGGKRRKPVRKKPPERGYAHYDGDTLARLAGGAPETLESSFRVTHAMMLNVLDRPGDGCAAMKKLLVDNHEPRTRQRDHIRRAVSVFRSLTDAGIVEVLDEPDELGRPVRVGLDLQDEFRLNQPLSLFAVEAVAVLDRSAADYHLQALSLVESIVEDPTVVLMAQLDRIKDELMTRMKAEGVEYEERMSRLAEVTWPRPEADFIGGSFEVFARHHPWVERDRPSPKSVVRDMLECADTFNQYVARYGLKRSEGVLLRYLSDCYRTLTQTVPAEAVTDELDDVIAWLGAVVRHVDSSLLDEWERLRHPEAPAASAPSPGGEGDDRGEGGEEGDGGESGRGDGGEEGQADITADRRAFEVMVRNEMFGWVQLLARRAHGELAARLAGGESKTWTEADLDSAMAPYWAEHDAIGIDGEARSRNWVDIDHGTGRVAQRLLDPAGHCEWTVEARIDRAASRARQRAVLELVGISRL